MPKSSPQQRKVRKSLTMQQRPDIMGLQDKETSSKKKSNKKLDKVKETRYNGYIE